jgi:hypothetical protein
MMRSPSGEKTRDPATGIPAALAASGGSPLQETLSPSISVYPAGCEPA